jgi:hypothetical protein
LKMDIIFFGSILQEEKESIKENFALGNAW